MDCFNLSSLSEFTIGRSPQCDLTLKEGKKISRRHAVLKKEGDLWVLENLSRFDHLFYKKKFIKSLELKDGVVFSCPPYEFRYEEAHLPDKKSVVQSPKAASAEEDTVTSFVKTEGLLKAVHPKKGEKSFFLSGGTMVFGRGTQWEASLEDDEKSPQAFFEVSSATEGFFIEPINGVVTFKNQKLSGRKKLKSGEQFSCQDWTFFFAEKDLEIEEKISRLPAPLVPVNKKSPLPFSESPLPHHHAGGSGGVFHEGKPPFYKSPFVKKTAGALVVFFSILAFFSDDDKDKSNEAKKILTPYEKLTESQRIQVKHSFDLALRQASQRNFKLCLEELKALHKLLPSYETSKDLEVLCENGVRFEREEEMKVKRQEQQRIAKRKAQENIVRCEGKFESFKTLEELNYCLAESIDLDPASPDLDNLRERLLIKLRSEKERRLELAEYQRKVAAGVRHYNRAFHHSKNTNLKKRIHKIQKYINTPYPDPNRLKPRARRSLASLETKFQLKMKKGLESCRSFLKDKQYKKAYNACHEVLKEDSGNQDIKKLLETVEKEKDKQMRTYYEEAILAEGFSHISNARVYWDKIIAEDIPDGKYYKKAKKKIKQYGENYK